MLAKRGDAVRVLDRGYGSLVAIGPGSLAHMAHAVLTTSVGSIYDDLPEFRYHFPKTYLNQVQAAVGD